MLALWLAGCGVALPPPTLDAVEPGRGWNGEDTLVGITGAGFFPQVIFDASATGNADLDRDFTAFLVDDSGGHHGLVSVSIESYERLNAVVQAGFEPGTYDLKVISPTGAPAALQDAFLVSETRADRVDLDSSAVSYVVGDRVVVEVTLVDPDGERVFEDAWVDLRISGEDGPVTVNWEVDALEDQVLSTDNQAISGRLGGGDGRALVPFTFSNPGTVTLNLTPLDGNGLLGDELKLEIATGAAVMAEIALPADPLEVTAGEPFLATVTLKDLLGNLVEDQVVSVLFEDLCGSWSELVSVSGIAPLEVVVTASTDPAGPCPVQRIVSALGESADFTVLPADVARFRVQAFPQVIRAGDEVNLLISAEDPYDNAAPWSGVLNWDDGLGLRLLEGCVVVDPATSLCQLVRTTASAIDSIRVTADDGTSGISNSFAVLPDDVAASLSLVLPPTAIAGVPFRLGIGVEDAFGNPIDPLAYPLDAFTIRDDLDEVECVFVAFEVDFSLSFDCTLFTTGTAAVQVTGPDGTAIDGLSTVVNGAIADVRVDAPARVVAGEWFVVSGLATDAWGNPIATTADPQFALDDDQHTFTPGFAVLDSGGAFAVAGILTAAGTTQLTATQAGVVLGHSDAIGVEAAPISGLALKPGGPWGWVGVPLAVVIEATDPFGNRAAWDGSVDVTGSGASAGGVAVTGGVGVVALEWSTPVASEILSGVSTDGVFLGASRPFHVASDCQTDPTPVLLFDGDPVGRACWDPASSSATLTASLAGSLSSGSPIDGYAVTVGDQVTTGVDAAPALTVEEVGRYDAGGLVIQADGCGAEVWTTAWVGPDDGSPVGPIDVVPATSPIDVLVGGTDLELLGGRDCAGDVAAFGTVLVRTDVGTVSGVSPTGSGLALGLDGNGDGTAFLSMASADSGGDATITAWAPSGAAAGIGVVAVTGDARRPSVWSATPEGEALTTILEIRVGFSEPLRASSVSPQVVSLVGPSGSEIVTVSLADADATIVIVPSAPLDGSLGAWDLTLDAEIRDVAGNRLDGAYDGTASDWVGQFGAVGAPVDLVTCTGSTDVLRPDGDAGAGAEADVLVVTTSSASQPDQWEVVVTQDEVAVAVWRAVALGPVDALTWDARDVTGRVVPNGVYVVHVTPLDAVGNRGLGCQVAATVDNHEVVP